MVVFIALSRWLFRAALVYRPDRVDELMALDEREALSDRPLLVRSLVVLALVTVAFALHGAAAFGALGGRPAGGRAPAAAGPP